MGLKIQYLCDSCGQKMSDDHRSMMCGCGGTFRNNDMRFLNRPSCFEPHYCDVIKQYVTSWKDQERKAAAFRSDGHPEGLRLLQENTRYMKKLKHVYKHREDIKHQQYAKDGIKYPKGKPVKFDDTVGGFVNKFTHEPINTKKHSVPAVPLRISSKLKTAAILVGFLLCSSWAFARIEGVPYVPLTVNGVTYDVPIHEPDFTEPKAKIVMDMLDGDKNSRKIFLQGKPKRLLFIGDGDKVRWLYVTEDKEWVVEQDSAR